ncbi:dipeptide/oligopeptide/nickel ABC transporter permease/ATP-binding protein [Kribbella sp. CWNU-51]
MQIRMRRRGTRTSTATIGLAGAVVLLLVAVIAPLLWSGRATVPDTDHLLEGMSAHHLLGTDGLGRDVFYRVMVATRTSLSLALLSAVSGAVCGVLFGALSTLLGQRAQRMFSSVLAIWLSFPDLLLVMFLSVIVGVGGGGAVVAVAIAFAPSFARLAQTLSSSVVTRDYISAVRLMGLSRTRILIRHVLPNVAEPLILNTTFAIGGALLFLSGLSFLGLGVQPPAYDWGQMLAQGLDSIYLSPLAALAPGVAIVIAGVVLNFCGEALAALAGRRQVSTRKVSRSSAASEEVPPALAAVGDQVLDVEGLRVAVPVEDGMVEVVRNFGLRLSRGEMVGVVGESGSGKSMSAMAVAGLQPPTAEIRAGTFSVGGTDPRRLRPAAARRLYARSLGMIFQDPMSSLNPLMTVGAQLSEGVRIHRRLSRSAARQLAARRLTEVRIPHAEQRLGERPHQFSGGMRQRAMIAMSLMCEPDLIIADEPTTALDVTIQGEIMKLLADANSAGVTVVLISHDISLILDVCDRVVVMYAGRIVEELAARDVTTAARHPYTRALLRSVPTMTTDRQLPLATIPGRPPTRNDEAAGCPFAPRCDRSTESCTESMPPLEQVGPGARLACWHPVATTSVSGAMPR